MPFEPILLMGALVLAGVVAGVTMAGMADPLGSLGGLAGQAPGTRTPWPLVTPGAPLDTSPAPSLDTGGPGDPTPGATRVPRATSVAVPSATVPAGPTPDPVSTPSPMGSTPGPTATAPPPTPVPADLVARRLVRLVTDDGYRGLADIDATYRDALGETTWSVRLGRTGEREWRLQEVRRPGSDPEVLERASLVSTTWERGARTDWVRRRKTERDRATAPLFDLTDAAQLSFRGLTEEAGVPLYRYGWGAGDARIDQFIRSMGGPEGLRLVSGELLATDRGVPVRLELWLTGDASATAPATQMRMAIAYSEVGSDIEVRSPRVGPPLVVRR